MFILLIEWLWNYEYFIFRKMVPSTKTLSKIISFMNHQPSPLPPLPIGGCLISFTSTSEDS